MIVKSLDQRQIQLVAFYAIPAVLLSLGGMTKKIIDGGPWRARHFFVGLDLTIYFLATCLVNILDLTKDEYRPANGYVWTVSLVTLAILFLFYQTTVHQDWDREDKKGWKQTLMLCGLSNTIGLVLLYGFMRLKLEGVL
jgi:hypothetical protein